MSRSVAAVVIAAAIAVSACRREQGVSMESASDAPDSVKERELAEAVKSRDVPKMNEILSPGLTPLHSAARWGKRDIVELWLRKGVNVNQRDGAGHTPLHLAAQYQHEDIVELLLDSGADANARDWSGHTPLYLAAQWAAEWDETGVGKKLLAKGAQVNAVNDLGQTPLHAAAASGAGSTSEDMVRMLLAHGADPLAREKAGAPPLIYAIGSRSAGSVEQLLADRIAYTQAQYDDFLRHAVNRGTRDMVEMLLNKGARVDRKDARGRSLLELSIYAIGVAGPAVVTADRVRTLDLLLSRGADVNARGENGGTPLHRAASQGLRDVAQTLLASRADVNARNEWGWTPLLIAVKQNQKDTAELLLAHGADVNARAKDGRTPLDYAWGGSKTSEEITALLRRNGGSTLMELSRQAHH